MVLVDEPAEQVPPADTSGADGNRFPSFGERGREVEPAMGPAAVVVGGIGPERPIQMTPTEDQRPVEALGPDPLDHPLGVGIRVRGPDRREDHPDAFGTDNLIERSAELGVPVTDEEPEGSRAIVETQREVAGLLGDPGRVGVSR